MINFGCKLDDRAEERKVIECADWVNKGLKVGGSGEWLDVFPWLQYMGHPDWKLLCKAEKRRWEIYDTWKAKALEKERAGEDVSNNLIIKLLKLKDKYGHHTAYLCSTKHVL